MKEKKQKIKIRNISLFKYVVSLVIGIIAVVCFITVATIEIITRRAIPDEVRRELAQENKRIDKAINFKDGEMVVDYKSDYNGYNYAVVDESGKCIIGDAPDAVLKAELDEKISYFGKVKISTESVYVKRERVINKKIRQMGQFPTLFIYGYIKESNVSTVYDKIRKTSISVIVILFVILGLIMLDIIKRMIKPLAKMYKITQRVNDSMDFAEKIEEESIFIEINSLTHAYNELFERIKITYDTQKRFNSDVSHELKTPIAVMSAQLQVARDKYSNDEAAIEMITVLERQTNIMNDLVTQLLQLSRIDNDSIELYSEPVNMDDLVDVVCEDLEISFDGFNSFDKKVDIEEILANNVLIITVVRNLVSNAVRYNVDNNPINIRVYAEGNDMILSVKDHGIGIAKEELPIVFDAFFRGEESRSSEGFGLGLTLTKRIVECYGGKISVSSELGKGSEFVVKMPVSYFEADINA